MSRATAEHRMVQNDVGREYWEKGYVVRHGLFSAEEAAAWRRECDRLVEATDLVNPHNIRTRFRTLTSGSRDLDRIDPVLDVSPLFTSLAHDERILTLVRAALGGPALPFKGKAMVKTPAITGYKTHQDFTYWQTLDVPADSLLSVLLAVDGAQAESGALELFPAQHRGLLTPAGLITDPDESRMDLSRGELVESAPGDVVVFHSLTPHRSRDNTEPRTRFQLYLSYALARHGELTERYYAHYRHYVRDHLPDEVKSRAYFR
jgi:ectoine hydroxylase-related dioxygenase (phytanoyl-CoA dioxygenase family)